MKQDKTYELKISFPLENKEETKQYVMAWLVAQGEETFVEGCIDSIDLDTDYVTTSEARYVEFGGEATPLLIYSFDQNYLENLSSKVLTAFTQNVVTALQALDTKTWQEGWKEYFKPIFTKTFCVYPPWETPDLEGKQMGVIINPGMAFGTGQHGTTKLCLEWFDALPYKDYPNLNFLDVGCGSGILAICASKLGFKKVYGCDIDLDAVIVTQDNAEINQTPIECWQGSAKDGPQAGLYDVVVANILKHVLEKILADIVKITKPQGLIIISGFLEEDRNEMLAFCEGLNLTLLGEKNLENWGSFLLQNR